MMIPNMRRLLWSIIRKVATIAPPWINRFPLIESLFTKISNLFTDRGVWVKYEDMHILVDPQEMIYDRLIDDKDVEPEVRKAIEKHVDTDDIVLDIGCRYGVQTFLLQRNVGSSGFVYSFDPIPQHTEFLKRSIRRNDISNIEVNNVAVSNKYGSTDILIPDNSTASASIKSTGNNSDISVSCIKLSDFIRNKSFNSIEFIKIDVEGSELEVIEGLGEEINLVSKMAIEIHNEKNTEHEQQKLFHLLRNNGDISNVHGDDISTLYEFNNTRQVLWKNLN